MPLIGTDLGEQFDERLIMQPGMVAVFEPVIWEEGASGYRSEDIVAVTDTGWVKLSGSTYEPYGAERMSPIAARSRFARRDDGSRGRRARRLRPAACRSAREGALGHGKPRSRCPDARWCRQCAVRIGCTATRAGRRASVRTCRGGGAKKPARVHLLSTWDEGVPPEIGYEDLYRMNWNPANLAADLAKIPGVREARRVGTDGLTPSSPGLIRFACHHRRIGRRSTRDVRCATDQDAGRGHLHRGGVGDRGGGAERHGRTRWRQASPSVNYSASTTSGWRSLGAPNPPSESVCFATPSQRSQSCSGTWHPTGPSATANWSCSRPARLYAGYEAGLARTRVAGIAGSCGDGRSGDAMCAGHGRADRRLPPGQHWRRPVPSVGERG